MGFGGHSRSLIANPETSGPYNWGVRIPFLRSPSILIIAMLAAIAVIVTGCGGDSATATPMPTSAPTATAMATPTPTPSPTAVPTETPVPEAPQAPDFSLSTGTGETYSLDGLLAGRDALVLVFYRSYL